MKRPYDLRHSGITWRLNSGVPATEVAAWAEHSVEMLMRVYAPSMPSSRCSGAQSEVSRRPAAAARCAAATRSCAIQENG
ncbi:MAG TPA: hypothetical protein VJ254_05445, partial [Streptosporangiaceae bacterium]|nr:hypothetical protein [Streptosporangiaceae bacterium]